MVSQVVLVLPNATATSLTTATSLHGEREWGLEQLRAVPLALSAPKPHASRERNPN